MKKSPKKKATKKSTKKSAPKKAAKPKKAAAPKKATAPAGFFSSGARGARNEKRKQFHVLLSESEYAKLGTLTHKMQRNAADVVRTLIGDA